MTSRTRTSKIAPTSGSSPTSPWIERACLLFLVALIPLRAFISETHTFELPRLFRSLDAPGTALPATTFLVVSLILLVLATLVARHRRPGGPAYRPTGMELGALILLAGMAISTLRAGQKHLALIGSVDFLGFLAYAAALRQLLTRPWRVRLVLTVLLATGAALSAKCAYQKWVETPETIRYFEEHKAELISRNAADAQEGSSSDDGFLYDYEQRLRSGAVSGYFAHPNVLASLFILLLLTGVGVVHERIRRAAPIACLVPILFIAVAALTLIGAQSKGAAAACLAAMGAWALGAFLTRKLRRRPGRTALAVWLIGLIVVILTPIVLAAQPEIMGRSMLFRWFYWRAAAAMMADQGVWGIGAGNFGRFFSRYKDVACPEDVDDPHGWIVKAATEWGAIGLAGLLVILAGVTIRLASSMRRSAQPPSAARQGDGGSVILWLAATGALAFGWWALSLRGTAEHYAALVLHLPAITWVVAFLAVAWEGGSSRTFSDAPLGPLLPAMIGAMIGFLLHAGVDLAFFQGGAATAFFAIIAVALAAAEGFDDAPRTGSDGMRRCAWSAAGIIAACGALVLPGLAVPAARLSEDLRTARTMEHPARWSEYVRSKSYDAYSHAVDRYRWDATAADELLDELTRRVETTDHAAEAMKLLAVMKDRDPESAVRFRHAATLHYQRFVLVRDPAELDAAIDAMLQCVARDPVSPNKRLTLADLYEKKAAALRDADPDGAADARRRAAEEIRTALDIDERRVYVSKPHRFTPELRTRLEDRMRSLDGR